MTQTHNRNSAIGYLFGLKLKEESRSGYFTSTHRQPIFIMLATVNTNRYRRVTYQTIGPILRQLDIEHSIEGVGELSLTGYAE